MKKMRIIPLTTAAVLASISGMFVMNAQTFTEAEIKDFAKVEGTEDAYDNVYIIGKHMFKVGIDLDDIMTASRTLGAEDANIIYRRSNSGNWTNAMNGKSVEAPTSFEIVMADYKPLEEDSELAKALNEKIEEVSKLKAEQYTSASYGELLKAVALPATNDGEKQTKIDAIDKAVKALVPSNLKTLNDLYAKYESLVATDYGKGNLENFNRALNKLKAEMPETTYEEIEAKISEIEKLEKATLTPESTSLEKSALTSAIDALYTDGHARTKLKENEKEYTKESYDNYKKAIENAISVETAASSLKSDLEEAKDYIENELSKLLVFSNIQTLNDLATTVNDLSKNVYHIADYSPDKKKNTGDLDGLVTSDMWDALKAMVTEEAIKAVLEPTSTSDFTYAKIQAKIDEINGELKKLVKSSTMKAYKDAKEKGMQLFKTATTDEHEAYKTQTEYADAAFKNLTDALGLGTNLASDTDDYDDIADYEAAYDALYTYVNGETEEDETTEEEEEVVITYDDIYSIAAQAINKAVDRKNLKYKDQDRLDNAYAAIDALSEGDYKAGSWADLQAAIAKAEKVEITSNTDVAYKAALLEAGIRDLNQIDTVVVTGLETTIDAQYQVDEEGKKTNLLVLDEKKAEYYEGSWADYANAIDRAEKLLAAVKDNNGLHTSQTTNTENVGAKIKQSEVDEAGKLIETTKTALLTKETGERLAAARTFEDEYNYAKDEALKAYKALIKANQDENGMNIAPVNEEAAIKLAEELETLRANLNAKNYEDLSILVEDLKELVENEYTVESYKDLKEALAEADKLSSNGSYTDNVNMMNKLNAAETKLVYANQQALIDAVDIEKKLNLNENDYVKASWDVLAAAITNAGKYLSGTTPNQYVDVNTIKFSDVQSAIDSVNDAYNKLVTNAEIKLNEEENKVAEARKAKSKYTEESFKKFEEAYAKASELKAGTIEEMTAKTTAITNALKMLVTTNQDSLDSLINTANGLLPENYDETTATQPQKDLKKAITAAENADVSTYEKVTSEIAKLNAAMNIFNKKAELNTLIEEATALILGYDSTDADQKALHDAIDQATAVRDNTNSTYENVTSEITSLTNAKVTYKKAELNTLIDEATALIPSYDETDEDQKALHDAIEAATVIKDNTTSTYENVTSEITSLTNAKVAYAKAELSALITEASALIPEDSYDPTNANQKALYDAIEAANDVIENTASTYDEVVSAKTTLEEKKAAL